MDNSNNKKNEVYSTSIKAGSRTYFFDVRENRKGDYFFTICESRKVHDEISGEIKFEKSKIYLYQDAFENFIKGYENVIDYIKVHKPEYFEGDKKFNNLSMETKIVETDVDNFEI